MAIYDNSGYQGKELLLAGPNFLHPLQLYVFRFSHTFNSQYATKSCGAQRADDFYGMGLHDLFLRGIFDKVFNPSPLNAQTVF